eukprot:351135-Chlamydomonas_euryale.AAC.5
MRFRRFSHLAQSKLCAKSWTRWFTALPDAARAARCTCTRQVNVDTKMARIMYITGESEELNLDEIARDMHMSIISLDA